VKSFLLKIVAILTIQLAIHGCFTIIWPTYHFLIGTLIVSIMTLNVLGAVAPLYIFKKANPLIVYVTSMFVRILLVGFLIIFLFFRFNPHTIVFIFTCIISYVFFQIAEVIHLSKNQDLFINLK